MSEERYFASISPKGGALVAKYNGKGKCFLWGSGDLKWEEDNDTAVRALFGFEDDFKPISKENALSLIKKYEDKKKA